MFMIHLCLLLCCVYVVLGWFFTSLVYVRLLASDLVPIDEALWVYLTYNIVVLAFRRSYMLSQKVPILSPMCI